MNKKLLFAGLTLGGLAVISLADFRKKTTQLCTLSSSSLPENITADCSKIYSGEKDSIRGIYEGKKNDYEWSCFRIKNEDDEQKARTSIEKKYFPPSGYSLDTYLFPEKVFCQVEGIHQR